MTKRKKEKDELKKLMEQCGMKKNNEIVPKAFYLIGYTGAFVVWGFVVKYLWNYVFVHIGLPSITFWHAIALMGLLIFIHAPALSMKRK